MIHLLRYESRPAFSTRTTTGELVFVQWIDVQSTKGTRAGTPAGRFSSPGARRDLRTADGRALEYVSKGRYRLATGECLISQDPKAP